MGMYQDSPETSVYMAARLWSVGGQPVFPCWPDKTPALQGGFKNASGDMAQVEKWFKNENFLIGVPTAGYIVVDLDKHSEEANGIDEWMKLVREHATDNSWRNTFMVRTPSGGIHIWFRDPTYPDNPHRNTASKLAPGVDTRANGGYVIIPPSRTDAGQYTIKNPAQGGGILMAPDWLVALLDKKPENKTQSTPSLPPPALGTDRATRYAEKALQGELSALANTGQGGRNHALNKAAFSLGQLVGSGLLDQSRVESELRNVALGIGLSEHETNLTIRSGMSAGMESPRSIPT